MLVRTEAVVLSLQKHTDTSSILHLYTREHGRVQYIVYGRKGATKQKKTGVSANIFSPLSLVEITADSNLSRTFPALKSASLIYVPSRINSDMVRQCIALFIAEALYKTLKHPMEDQVLFDYISEIIRELDLSDSVEHIPAVFLTRLSELLGYGGEPMEELSDMKSVGLLEGVGLYHK